MFDDTFSAEEQQRCSTARGRRLGRDRYEHFRELMQTLGRRRRGSGTIDSLRAYAEDVALAVRTLGGEQSAQLRRKDLRLAGQLVRAQLHGFEDARATALLRARSSRRPRPKSAPRSPCSTEPRQGGWPPASDMARAQLEAVLPDAAHAAMHVEHSAWAERNSLNTLEPRASLLSVANSEAEPAAAAEKSGDDSEQSWVGEASAALPSGPRRCASSPSAGGAPRSRRPPTRRPF